MPQLSDAIRLMFAPAREYRARAAVPVQGAWRGTLTSVAAVAALLGIVAPIAATRRVTIAQFLSSSLCWSFVPLLQLGTGLTVFRPWRSRVPLARAMELYFAAHGPWSLWLVLVAARFMGWGYTSVETLVALSVLPSVWTAYLLIAFAREVIGLPQRSARAHALAHQLVTWVLIFAYVEFATRLSVRLIGAAP